MPSLTCVSLSILHDLNTSTDWSGSRTTTCDMGMSSLCAINHVTCVIVLTQVSRTSSAVIGSGDSGAATTAQFQAFWQELASRFAINDKVM